MAAKGKSFLKKNLCELVEEMQQLGGGINVKMSETELIGVLPNQSCSLLSEVISPKHSGRSIGFKQTDFHKKEFRYDNIVRSEEDLVTKLLSQQYLEEWFLQGFNLNFIVLGKDQQDLDAIALKILNKCKYAPNKSMHLSMQCVRFTPRSSDNFRSEDILDTITNSTALTNITDAKVLELTEAIDYLEKKCSSKSKTSRNTLLQVNSSKLSNIETQVIRIHSAFDQSKNAEINIIGMYSHFFNNDNNPSLQTKYELAFERSIQAILSEAKAVKYIANSSVLARASYQKTRLIEYLVGTVFSSAKNVVVCDYSGVQEGILVSSSALQRLQIADKFGSFGTLCRRYSGNPVHQASNYPSDFNSLTKRFERNQFDDSFEEDTKRVQTTLLNSPDLEDRGHKKYDEQQYEKDLPLQLSQNMQDIPKKTTFKEEMRGLLDRLEKTGDQNRSLNENKGNLRSRSQVQQVKQEEKEIMETLQEGRESKNELDSAQKRMIAELQWELADCKSRYQIELGEQRDLIRNQSARLLVLGEQNGIFKLVQMYESELFESYQALAKSRQQLEQIMLAKFDTSNDENQVQNSKNNKNIKSSSNSKVEELKRRVSTLSAELSQSEELVIQFKRQIRQNTSIDVIEGVHKKTSGLLQSQVADLKGKNEQLVVSVSSLSSLVESLKQQYSAAQKEKSILQNQLVLLQEDKNTLEQLLHLQNNANSQSQSCLTNIRKGNSSSSNSSNQAQANSNSILTVQNNYFQPTAIDNAVNTLKRLTLKTGSGVPESLISSFKDQLKNEWDQMFQQVTLMKQQQNQITEFLTHLLTALELELGRNNVHVKELNKIVSRFLLDSMAERQEPQRSRTQPSISSSASSKNSQNARLYSQSQA